MELKLTKTISLLSYLFLTVASSNAQTDSSWIEPIVIPNASHVFYKYNAKLQAALLCYDYSNLWDFDNDAILDSIQFIGNGGAHTYFSFQLKLSTGANWNIFPTFQIDMPYPSEEEKINPSCQFAVFDFDQDGISEIYLNIDNPFGSIPKKLKMKGLSSKKVLIDVEKGKLLVKNN